MNLLFWGRLNWYIFFILVLEFVFDLLKLYEAESSSVLGQKWGQKNLLETAPEYKPLKKCKL